MPSSERVLVLSGPNLDRLGQREPEIYGTQTLADVHAAVAAAARRLRCAVECRQSNHEGALIDWIGAARAGGFQGIVLNPGGLTHTSIALLDAVKGCELPVVEVHLSNPDAREAFRRRSYVGAACIGRIAGFGAASYVLALEGIVAKLRAAGGAPRSPRRPAKGTVPRRERSRAKRPTR